MCGKDQIESVTVIMCGRDYKVLQTSHIFLLHFDFFVFFFQAGDGIRYLVRSRGLGVVYKIQT